jgi:hypothetical protein
MAEPKASPWTPEQWPSLEHWLWGVDLFNHAYWWESHEQHEALWHAAGRTSEHARFVQGVIKVAAACLNREVGKREIARDQAEAGIALLGATRVGTEGSYMGLDVAAFCARVADWMASGTQPPVVTLAAQ